MCAKVETILICILNTIGQEWQTWWLQKANKKVSQNIRKIGSKKLAKNENY